MTVILIYSIFGMINMVPLANVFHFETCAIPVMLVAAFFLARTPFLLRKGWLRTLYRAGLWLSVAAMLGFLVVYNPLDVAGYCRFTTDIRDFEYTFLDEDVYLEILQVDAFVLEEKVKGNEVYIVDNMAALYFAPLDIYHKYLDMFLLGNLGMKTPQECLEESDGPASVYLFSGSERSNTQYPSTAVSSFRRKHRRDGTLGDEEVLGELDIYRYISEQ